MSIYVLRLGHRFVRDDRTTTHVALVSRAFGCKKIFMTEVDDSILQTVKKVCEDWGGSNEFGIEIIHDWKSLLSSWKKQNGMIVHLTMYGINIENQSLNFSVKKNILLVRSQQGTKGSLFAGRFEYRCWESTSFRNCCIGNFLGQVLSW